jgi:hypothetical protein
MTYSSGGLIQATDYNGFVSTTARCQCQCHWSTGTPVLDTDKLHWLLSVPGANTVTATQWASLVNTVSAMASHQGTTITARTAPVTGQHHCMFECGEH